MRYKHGAAWTALMTVFDHLLFNAYNVLVQHMNENNLNSEEHPEFWVCSAIDHLLVYGVDAMWHKLRPLEAMQDYITEVWGISRYAYKAAGRGWSDDDLMKEIFILWSREVGEMFLWNFIDLPEGWVTPHIGGRKPRVYETDGILLRHEKGVVQ